MVVSGQVQQVDATGAVALAKYYQRLILVGTLVLAVLIGMTLWFGWQHASEQEVSTAVHQVQERAIRLKDMLKAADDHVLQLTRWAEDYPKHYPDLGANEVRKAVQSAMAASKGGEFNLDALGNLPTDQRLGLLNSLNSAAQPRPHGKPSNLDLAISLLDHFKYGQSTSSFLRWSYFFSAKKDLHVMSPWASSGEVLGAEQSIRTFLQESWTYEITKRGLPVQNPKHVRYWTKAYLDQAGAGMMVSLGAPIYWGDEFIGVMGTDVLLGFLSEFLWQFPDPDGLLVITNEYGQLLADRRGATTAAADVQSVDVTLPASLRPWLQQNTQGLEQGQRIGDNYVIAVTLDDPRWTILYVLPRSVVTARTLKHYVPQLIVSILLMISLVIVHRILWRLYVAPALAVANFVVNETVDASPPPPVVPPQWKTWVDAMTRVFSERRQYMAQLAATNEILEHRVAERTQELVAANEQLEKLATTDPLTGAFNRRQLFRLLEDECERASRDNDFLSILLLDADHFKQINDTYGHVVGDAALVKLVERCNHAVRPTDSICRYGGEEFLVLLPFTDQSVATMMGERLRSAISATPVVIDQQSIPMTVSVGVATYKPGEPVEGLIHRADQMLYAAKAAGRNRLVRGQ
ncbi:MAG TPA: diguanylate cyclase [Rhodocyclaceae bacterium]|nr:diguanylate cyclase [Rhodocyclaceae bacterium]